MTQEFIPYESALALKELGFDEPCFGWFRSTLIPSNFTEFFLETEFGMNESPSDWVNSNFLDEACSAPLYQQAFRWFREKYDLRIWIESNYGVLKFEYVIATTNFNFIDKQFNDLSGYNTYEEAELACLIKLIETVKTKQL
jgi:hypothetical protein